MSDVTDAQREIAGIVAEFHRKIRMRTGMVDAISRIVVSDGLSLALGIPRDGAIFGNVELVPDPGVRAAAAEALEDATPAVPGPPEVEWRYGPDCAEASVGPLDLDVYNNGHGYDWSVAVTTQRSIGGIAVARCNMRSLEPTLDAAKAAAIAAARAWRDSIRL